MRIFEFQFNPKASKDRFLQVFSFEAPEEEKSAAAERGEKGSIFVVGDLRHALPQNSSFLKQVANALQKEYFAQAKKTQKLSREVSLKSALKKTNSFLTAEAKKGNTDWLGNLHVAVLLVVPTDKGYSVYFTKVGNTSLWMARNNALVDMGKSIEAGRKEEGTAKIFGAVGSGSVLPHDRIFILTEELFDSFSRLNLLHDLAQMQEEKQFRQLFKNKEKELAKISGILYFLLVEPLSRVVEVEAKPAFTMPRFSFPNFSKGSLQATFKLLANPHRLSLPKLKLPKKEQLRLPAPSSLSLPKMPVNFIEGQAKEKLSPFRNIPPTQKAVALLFVLAVILGIGFALIKSNSPGISPEAMAALESARNLHFQAEQAIILQDENQANRLLQEAWAKLNPHTRHEEFAALQREIESALNEVNKITVLESPEVFATIDTSGLGGNPEAMFALDTTFYVFRSSSEQLVSVDAPSGAHATFSAGRNLRFGGVLANTFVFFADPNRVVSFNETSGWTQSSVSFPSNFAPQGMSIYAGSMYLFDGASGQIVRVRQGTGVPWIEASSIQKPFGATDIAIDSNIWVVKTGGEIQRYFRGRHEESLALTVFPALATPTKVETSAQRTNIYILEPAEKRVLVVSKFGDLIAQYKADAFENARDLVVSANGDTVYILAGDQIFRVQNIPTE